MGSCIHSIEYYLPDIVIDNNQLSREFPEWQAEKILEKVGIKRRHVASAKETALDLAFNAAEKLFNSVDRESVDFVILCTQSPDYYLPTSACLLHDRLGLRKNTGAFDFNLGCSGYIYGLAIAKSLINTKVASNILLVTAETYSKHIHHSDKANRSIFGDAAAASLISYSDDEKILEFELGTDGKGGNNLIVKRRGLREMDSIDEDLPENYLYMNGPEIFNFTLDVVPDLVNNVLLKNEVKMEDIDFCIFHQANKFILEYLRKKLNIDPVKYYADILETGNTVSSTIPIALKECLDSGTVVAGNKVLLVGFGVGYSWGASVIKI
jgi:3-oxoacyl-[acyl-carrier-protein] synthase-3